MKTPAESAKLLADFADGRYGREVNEERFEDHIAVIHKEWADRVAAARVEGLREGELKGLRRAAAALDERADRLLKTSPPHGSETTICAALIRGLARGDEALTAKTEKEDPNA